MTSSQAGQMMPVLLTCWQVQRQPAMLLSISRALRRPALDDHRHAESRTERDEGPRLDSVAGHQVKTVALRECRDNELGFDEREVVPDALAWPGAEGHVDEFR